VSRAKQAEPIKTQFVGQSRVGPKNRVLDGSEHLPPKHLPQFPLQKTTAAHISPRLGFEVNELELGVRIRVRVYWGQVYYSHISLKINWLYVE